jgi:hypothetical protein
MLCALRAALSTRSTTPSSINIIYIYINKQLLLRSDTLYYSKGSIVADSHENARHLMVILSGEVCVVCHRVCVCGVFVVFLWCVCVLCVCCACVRACVRACVFISERTRDTRLHFQARCVCVCTVCEVIDRD